MVPHTWLLVGCKANYGLRTARWRFERVPQILFSPSTAWLGFLKSASRAGSEPPLYSTICWFVSGSMSRTLVEVDTKRGYSVQCFWYILTVDRTRHRQVVEIWKSAFDSYLPPESIYTTHESFLPSETPSRSTVLSPTTWHCNQHYKQHYILIMGFPNTVIRLEIEFSIRR